MPKQVLYQKLAYIFILIVLIWITSNINWASHRYTRIIKVDGNGYYAYLPAIFLYNDLNFSFFDEIREKYDPSNFEYDYRYNSEGRTVNKYYCGTAVAWTPFFLAGHLLTLISGHEADGYSYYYLIMLSISAIFYLFLSLLFLDKTLKLFDFKINTRILIILFLVFGTNLLYYTVHEPSLSHVYSLAFISVFLWALTCFSLDPGHKYLLISAFALGMVILIRPVNVIIILAIPFLWGSKDQFWKIKSFIYRSPWSIIIPAFLFLVMISIQFIIYYVQTGSFWVYSYGDEGFNFFSPHLIDFLISYKKGLFVYTPVTFVSLFGAYYLFRENRFRFWALITFLTLVVYVLSSWHMWYYGGSFSSRVMVEYFPFFMILLAYLLQNIRPNYLKKGLLILLVLLVILNLVQTYQYYTGRLHWDSMDFDRYWAIFMRIDDFIK